MIRVFCKLCNRATKHMDFRPLPVQFKCMECGEYNQGPIQEATNDVE